MKGNLRKKVCEAQKCANLSDCIDNYFTEPVAMLFSKLFIKLKFGPNFVTLLSLITGVAGGIFFWLDKLEYTIIGIALEIICMIFDTSDGQVARLTGKQSPRGRFFDGVADGLVYSAIYIGVCHGLMDNFIPFTDTPWGWYIWILGIFCGLYLHTAQANVADYFRTLHIFFCTDKKAKEFTRSKKIAKELKDGNNTFFQKLWKKGYCIYTKNQERTTKQTQKMLDVIDEHDGFIPDEMRNYFREKSNKIVRKTNLLTVNLRTYILFILLLFDQAFFIFPFVIFVLEPIKLIIKAKYENIAKTIVQNNYYLDKE